MHVKHGLCAQLLQQQQLSLKESVSKKNYTSQNTNFSSWGKRPKGEHADENSKNIFHEWELEKIIGTVEISILVVFDTDHLSKARLSVLSPTTTKMLKIQTQVNKLPTAPNWHLVDGKKEGNSSTQTLFSSIHYHLFQRF